MYRCFYLDDATPELLAERTLEFSRSSTVIKLTPDPQFMLLSFGGRTEAREHNDVRPKVLELPMSSEAHAWRGFRLRDCTHTERVLETVRLLKASPEAASKPVYVNVFSPFTVAMQCDTRLVERFADESETAEVAQGLSVIAEATAEYISALAAAGADGIFIANKSIRCELGRLVDDWVIPLDKQALSPLRKSCDQGVGGIDTTRCEPGCVDRDRRTLDVVLHCCGTHIDYERILSALSSGSVYPEGTALSWNLDETNPSLEYVLETTSLRIFGTYSCALLGQKFDDDDASNAFENFLVRHRQWLEDRQYLHRVVIAPDCSRPGGAGPDVPVANWNAVDRVYSRWMSSTPAVMA
jgi:hypothetical protein